MKHSVRIARNTSWLVIAMAISRVLNAIFIILLANHLLPGDFGIYNFAMAIAYVASVVTDWGFDELTIREISRKPHEGPSYLGSMLITRMMLGLATFGALAAIFYLAFRGVDDGISLNILLMTGAIIILEKMAGSFIAIFQAHERMDLNALASVSGRSFFLSLGLLGIFLGYELINILYLLFLSSILNFIVSHTIYRSRLGGTVKTPSYGDIRSLIKKALPFTIFILVSVIYGHVIVLILSILQGTFETGIYSASWKIIVFFGAVPYSFGRALYPVFSKFSTSDDNVMENAYINSLRYLLMISLPLTIGLFIIAEDVLSLIYHVEYRQTIHVFRVMIWTIPFLFMNGSLKMVLWGSNKTMTTSRNLGLASIFLIIFGVFFIMGYGVVGAAAAVVLAEMIHFFVNYHSVNSFMKPADLHILWKPYVACGTMALLLYIPTGLSVILSVPIAISTYFVVLYLIQGITKKDIDVLKGTFGFKNDRI